MEAPARCLKFSEGKARAQLSALCLDVERPRSTGCILFGGWVVFRGNRTLEGTPVLGIEDTVSLPRHSPMFQRMCPAWGGKSV